MLISCSCHWFHIGFTQTWKLILTFPNMILEKSISDQQQISSQPTTEGKSMELLAPNGRFPKRTADAHFLPTGAQHWHRWLSQVEPVSLLISFPDPLSTFELLEKRRLGEEPNNLKSSYDSSDCVDEVSLMGGYNQSNPSICRPPGWEESRHMDGFDGCDWWETTDLNLDDSSHLSDFLCIFEHVTLRLIGLELDDQKENKPVSHVV